MFKILLSSFISGVIAYSPALLMYRMPSFPIVSIKPDQKTLVLKFGYNALILFGIVQSVVLVGIFY